MVLINFLNYVPFHSYSSLVPVLFLPFITKQFFEAVVAVIVWLLDLRLPVQPLVLWVRIPIRARCATLCDKVCQWHAAGRWFSPGPPVSSTNKTDRNDITEILLKVALNTIKPKQFLDTQLLISKTSNTWRYVVPLVRIIRETKYFPLSVYNTYIFYFSYIKQWYFPSCLQYKASLL